VDGLNLATLWQGFFQGDWKVARNLTLNLGLRYEYYSPWVNNRGKISRFDPAFPGGRLIYPRENFYFVPGPGFIATDRPLASPGLFAPDRNDFGPRFGFAWRPRGSNRSAIRGSYWHLHRQFERDQPSGFHLAEWWRPQAVWRRCRRSGDARFGRADGRISRRELPDRVRRPLPKGARAGNPTSDRAKQETSIHGCAAWLVPRRWSKLEPQVHLDLPSRRSG
jgi:hypothetical protein